MITGSSRFGICLGHGGINFRFYRCRCGAKLSLSIGIGTKKRNQRFVTEEICIGQA